MSDPKTGTVLYVGEGRTIPSVEGYNEGNAQLDALESVSMDGLPASRRQKRGFPVPSKRLRLIASMWPNTLETPWMEFVGSRTGNCAKKALRISPDPIMIG